MRQNYQSKFAAVWLAFTVMLLLSASEPAGATEYELDRDNSIFAVITHKAGFASGLAHDHMVYPSEFEVELSISDDAETLEASEFRLSFPVKNLVVDDLTSKNRWFPHIKKLKIKNEDFPNVSGSDRKKIREAMLSESQLNASAFPEFLARVTNIESLTDAEGRSAFSHRVTVETHLHGATVAKEFQASIQEVEGKLTVEAVGKYRFTEFGIEPYSAFFGAVKNKDDFEVFVYLTASRTEKR